MKALQEHWVGAWPLLEWVAGHKTRNEVNFPAEEQLRYAIRIAETKDESARKLMLELLGEATRLQSKCSEMHREFDTLAAALNKIDRNNP